MNIIRFAALALCLGAVLPSESVYAGDAKSGSVFPRNLSVEEIARMVYEAAKNDPANAAVVFMDALSSRDSWSAAELRVVAGALLLAVPDMPPTDVVSLLGGANVSESVVEQITAELQDSSILPQDTVIEVRPADVPVYPVIPSPDEASGVR